MTFTFASGDWTASANCHGYEHLFTPEKATLLSDAVRRALRRCAMCPVRARCLRWGLTDEFEYDMPVFVRDTLEWVVNTHRVAEQEVIFGGSTLEDRRLFAHLPIPEQEVVLEARFRAHAFGLLPLVAAEEWIESAPLQLAEVG